MNLGIIGITGKMGRKILEAAKNDPDLHVVFGLASENSSDLDSSIFSRERAPFEKVDILIDFSVATATAQNIEKAMQYKKPILIGTTGILPEVKELLNTAKKEIPILISSNFSLGIHLLKKALRVLSKELKDVSTQIIETHHINKKDAPSGTALDLKAAIGNPNTAIKSIRKDDVSGEHTVIFHMEGEEIILTHKACNRDLFALGALRAAKLLKNQPPGLYTLEDLM